MYPQLTEHFKATEFACKCKARGLAKDATWCQGQEWVDLRLVEQLEVLRARLGRPIYVVSGCRCPRYNQLVGGAPLSQHVRGKAADIQVAEMTPYELALEAVKVGFPSVATYDTFVHVDIREMNPWRSIESRHDRPMRGPMRA